MPGSKTLLSEQITQRLASIQEQVAEACGRVGRNPDEVTIIGVTKVFPVTVVEAAVQSGLVDLGENRVQELVTKAEAFPGVSSGGPVRWHLIGPLQRNKARFAAQLADVFHALDSERLAVALDRHAGEADRVLSCLIQVNISGEASKSGVSEVALDELIDRVSRLPHIRVRGVMSIGSFVANAEDARPEMARMRALFEARKGPRDWDMLSMGMSGDFQIAIEEGATHIRVGTAIFGSRH